MDQTTNNSTLHSEKLEPQDALESRDFFDLMQNYRHASASNQAIVCERFEAVKAFIRAAPSPASSPEDHDSCSHWREGDSDNCVWCGDDLGPTTEADVASSSPVPPEQRPIDMILFCPRCGTQHVDAPESEETFQNRMQAFGLVAEPQDRFPSRWTNPPHKSHLCHNCYAVWRPADVPTNGVAQIKTRGKEDNTWTNSVAVPASLSVREAAEEIRNYVDGLICAPPMRDFERNEIERIISKYFCSPVSAAGGDEDEKRCTCCDKTACDCGPYVAPDSRVIDDPCRICGKCINHCPHQ